MIVTSDHGSSYWRGDRRRALTERNLADIAQVPLFVKLPGQSRAEISQRNAKLHKQAQKLRGSAQEMKHSMQKSEVQKNSFKDEADALEDELGF